MKAPSALRGRGRPGFKAARLLAGTMFGMGRLWMGLMGAFFLAWGGWELGEMLGWVPEARFPWPLFIVLLGGAFLIGAWRGGWGDCWETPREETQPR